MAKFRSKAETNFEVKLKKAVSDRDWSRVEALFNAYGSYLVLLED